MEADDVGRVAPGECSMPVPALASIFFSGDEYISNRLVTNHRPRVAGLETLEVLMPGSYHLDQEKQPVDNSRYATSAPIR